MEAKPMSDDQLLEIKFKTIDSKEFILSLSPQVLLLSFYFLSPFSSRFLFCVCLLTKENMM